MLWELETSCFCYLSPHYFPIGLGFSPGAETLIGTSGNDVLYITNQFDALIGGDGNDSLYGSPSFRDRLFGGKGNDFFHWSEGNNVYHGGQLRLDYSADGYDAIDYKGVGFLHIDGNDSAIPNKTPSFVAYHDTGADSWYSIDAITFNPESDRISLGKGVNLLPFRPVFHLGAEAMNDKGDSVTFDTADAGLIINASNGNNYFVQGLENDSGSTGGVWLESAESIKGSEHDDKIFAGAGARTLEGGGGNDLIDARDATAFARTQSGHDVDIFGGEGDDTIVSNAGISYASGGGGADRFILSTTSETDQTVEFVINDADGSDSLFVAHAFFTEAYLGFDSSPLLQLKGGFTQHPGESTFGVLPQNLGPFKGFSGGRSDYAIFQWQTQDQKWNGGDQTHGAYEFEGGIFYNREGGDLIIHVMTGFAQVVSQRGYADQTYTYTRNSLDTFSEAIIRVKNFTDGDLGIRFYDLGVPEAIDLPVYGARPLGVYSYPGWDAGVAALTDNGTLTAALDLRPVAPDFDPAKEIQGDIPEEVAGTSDHDTISISIGTAHVSAGAGDDVVSTASGDDRIDGGAGADTMQGGAGNDSYAVDNTGDVIIEIQAGGLDIVTSTISYTLGANVERLQLAGNALTGTGNNLANGLYGNDLDNILIGLNGADVLSGGGGNDVLNGGGGNDIYVYQAGDSADIIIDGGPSGEADKLVLDGIDPRDIHFYILSNTPNDLTLTFNDGGSIVLKGFLNGSGQSIENIEFSGGGPVWDRAQLNQFAATAPVVINTAPVAVDDLSFGIRAGTTIIDARALTANDFDHEGDVLNIISVDTVTAGIDVSVDANGNVRVITPDVFEGRIAFNYVISDGVSSSSAAVALTVDKNNAPIAAGAVSDQIADAGVRFNFALPADLFTDPDGNALVLSALRQGGAALPAWLSFDATTGLFSGTPPKGRGGVIDITVTGSDGAKSDSVQFKLAVTGSIDGLTENVATGTVHADKLTGSAGVDVITGLAGNDLMRGLGGDDRFIISGSHSGFDIFIGGDGFDVIAGSSQNDVIGLAKSAANLSGIESIDGGAGYDVLRLGPHNDRLDLSQIQVTSIELIAAGAGADRVTGSSGNDVISGGTGNDVLKGGAGDDVFVVSGYKQGHDTFVGGAGFDTILGSAGADVIGLAAGLSSSSGIEAIDGGAGHDILRLSGRGDVLDLTTVKVTSIELIDAGGGNDRLIGSLGDDQMRGGAGWDQFIFRGNFGHDVITDFTAGTTGAPSHDVIDLRGLGLHSFGSVLAHSVESAGGVKISISSQASLLLEGVHLDELRANDFLW